MAFSNKGGGGDDDDGAAEEDGAKQTRQGVYLGHFAAGKRGCLKPEDIDDMGECEGTFTYANGDMYVGQWCAGKKHGRGTYTYAKDDTKLIGEWEAGKITSGKWCFPNGTFYSGRFRYNKPWGKGVWVFQNGNQLIGEYVQKEQSTEDEPAEPDPDSTEQRPDPKVWCSFKHGRCTAVQGGSMFAPSRAA